MMGGFHKACHGSYDVDMYEEDDMDVRGYDNSKESFLGMR